MGALPEVAATRRVKIADLHAVAAALCVARTTLDQARWRLAAVAHGAERQDVVDGSTSWERTAE
ncbi:hypothetical protein GCM10027280_50110 [Micromonospora polyrhachis]|uniref:Uncharacterized protein n=1 Tax=Micromonospora polyrhachis TaxID=1282883 RepID=A0A7W7STK5_9ACTN|nr:hypothetical protein [Micromonospora polyrhachis]